jgi:hypothetical protein
MDRVLVGESCSQALNDRHGGLCPRPPARSPTPSIDPSTRRHHRTVRNDRAAWSCASRPVQTPSDNRSSFRHEGNAYAKEPRQRQRYPSKRASTPRADTAAARVPIDLDQHVEAPVRYLFAENGCARPLSPPPLWARMIADAARLHFVKCKREFAMPKYDVTKLNVAIDKLLAVTQNPRHRFLLQAYSRHRCLEVAGPLWRDLLTRHHGPQSSLSFSGRRHTCQA